MVIVFEKYLKQKRKCIESEKVDERKQTNEI